MKKFLSEFKEFAMKGNIIDMAVGVVIGAAFGKIVTALVENIISPLIGILVGDTSLAAKKAIVGSAEITYGAFLQAIIDFIIIALCLFLVLKAIMAAKTKLEALKKKEEEPAAEEEAPADTELSVLLEIKELLKKEK